MKYNGYLVRAFVYGASAIVCAVMTGVHSARWHASMKTEIVTCQVALASARIEADAGARIEAAKAEGRLAGLAEATDIRRATEVANSANHEAKCNPWTPPCCDGTADEDNWPKPSEFRNGSLLMLSCARTVHQRPEQGAAWVCGRTETRCMASKQRSGQCAACYVYLASGGAAHEDYAWTGHAIDETDGPWNASGTVGVFP